LRQNTHDNHEHDSEKSSVGQPAGASRPTKTIHVTALDTMRYQFSETLDFNDGDVVKFVITNKGKIPHEFSIGDEAEQKGHRKMMKKMQSMVHQDGNTITLKQGETKELIWQWW